METLIKWNKWDGNKINPMEMIKQQDVISVIKELERVKNDWLNVEVSENMCNR